MAESHYKVNIYGMNDIPLTFDSSTHAIEVIDYAHHEIHGGSAYFLTYVATVADTADLEIRFATPNTTKWSHFILSVNGSGETTVDLYEGTSLTHAAGNALTPINRNRNSANTSGMTWCHTPGGSGDGSVIFQDLFGIDTGGFFSSNIQGGNADSRGEIILKQNTAYLLRVTSGTDGNRIQVMGDWYEHTNK